MRIKSSLFTFYFCCYTQPSSCRYPCVLFLRELNHPCYLKALTS